MSIFRVFYVLTVTLLGLLFFYQQSIEIYWQQTYHSISPLTSIRSSQFESEHQWLDSGSQLTGSLTKILDQQERHLDYWNNKTIDEFNDWLDLSIPEQTHHVPISTLDETTKELEVSASNEAESVSESIETTLDHHDLNVEINQPDTNNSIDIAENLPIAQSTPSHLTPDIIELHAGDKLFFVGDSLMQGVAPRVKRSLYNKYKIEGLDLSKQSTGLSYPKAFDWPKVVEDTLAEQPNIKLMVVFLGPNDPWHFPGPNRREYLKFKSDEWEQVYRARIERILDAAQNHDVPVIWLGVPCMRKTKLHQDMLYLNSLYQSEMNKFGARYLSTSELLGCSDEKYMNFVTTDRGNIKVRIDDGIHFTVAGQRILAERIIAELSLVPHEQEEVESE